MCERTGWQVADVKCINAAASSGSKAANKLSTFARTLVLKLFATPELSLRSELAKLLEIIGSSPQGKEQLNTVRRKN
jgi:hypothetical protein